MDLAGSSALIIGGAGGLGGATSRRLIELGAGVVIFDVGDHAVALADELGERAVLVSGDQSDEDAVQNAIDEARRLGTFRINVNAAGRSVRTPPVVTVDGSVHDMARFRQVLEEHLAGPFNVARLCAGAFSQNVPDADGERGVIILTSSVAAFDGQFTQVAYSTAKAGIVGMTLSMARDVARVGIRVCAIAPGPMETPMFAVVPDEAKQALIKNIAFPKRLGQPYEYATLVEMILRTPFLNGQTIRMDGAISQELG